MRISFCREFSCRAEIVWLRTASGGNMPVDAATITSDDTEQTLFDAARHTSHYATCTKPKQFRRSRK